MNCKQCNAQLPEGSAFCAVCGAAQDSAAPATTQTSTTAATAVRSVSNLFNKALAFCKMNKRIVIIAAAALVVVIVLLVVLTGGNNPESVAMDWMEAVVEEDLEKFESTYYPERISSPGELVNLLRAESQKFDEVENCEIEIVKTKELTAGQMRKTQQRFALDYGVEITEMWYIEVKVTGEKNGKPYEHTEKIYPLEVDGDWYIDFFY